MISNLQVQPILRKILLITGAKDESAVSMLASGEHMYYRPGDTPISSGRRNILTRQWRSKELMPRLNFGLEPPSFPAIFSITTRK